MNISYRWLKAVAPTIGGTPEELAARLGMLGAPVDELVHIGAELGDVVIARVEEVRQHPNADRLRVCRVNAGGDMLQVVCGAPNVEAGGFYPFAPIGATLPGGFRIGRAKLRGETSEGMLCSARELGLGRDHAGLMTLHGEWAPGASFRDELGLDDARLLVDITANRSDLLSHVGVARELAPGGVADIRLEPFSDRGGEEFDLREAEREGEAWGMRIRLEDPIGCTRYAAAVIRGVSVGPSPEWLAGRLRAIGVRPINNVVDATNYVLFELGQPLHAFDLHRLRGGEVRVREANAGERIRTLDGEDRALEPGMLLIADAEGAIAVAGVMGGEESEVSDETRDILLECAHFDEKKVRRTARALGLSTDASYRFERGVDPEGQPKALRRVVDLIVAVAGGEADAVGLDVRGQRRDAVDLTLRAARVRHVLGVEVGAVAIGPLLEPLGFATQVEGEDVRVRVPGFRPDVTREIDLIEEVARRYGYDSFPDELGAFRPGVVPEDPLVAVRQRLQRAFEGNGFLEARSASFAPGREGRVPLLNPLSSEESHLRDTLAHGLLRRLEHNWAHGVRNVRLYETGVVFHPAEGNPLPVEQERVAAVFTGARQPPHWSGPSPSFDIWDLKALLGELAGTLLEGATLRPGADSLDAVVERDEGFTVLDPHGEVLGFGGRVRRAAMDAPAWAEAVWLLELRVPAPAARAAVEYRALPAHPATERDLALLVPAGVEASQVETVVRESAGPLLEHVGPFDFYVGKGIPEGSRSIAWRLRFRATDRTLTDAEVETTVGAILSRLDEGLGVRRR